MNEEQYCYQALAELRKSYERAAKPYIDRLVTIRSTSSTSSITLTLDQAREFIDFMMSTPPDCGEAGHAEGRRGAP
jgi:hypothetical protein